MQMSLILLLHVAFCCCYLGNTKYNVTRARLYAARTSSSRGIVYAWISVSCDRCFFYSFYTFLLSSLLLLLLLLFRSPSAIVVRQRLLLRPRASYCWWHHECWSECPTHTHAHKHFSVNAFALLPKEQVFRFPTGVAVFLFTVLLVSLIFFLHLSLSAYVSAACVSACFVFFFSCVHFV